MADITILGSGGFGLALAIMCDNAGHKVTVWSKFQDEIDAIKRTGELKAKLPGVQVNKTIELTTDISCVKDKDMVVRFTGSVSIMFGASSSRRSSIGSFLAVQFTRWLNFSNLSAKPSENLAIGNSLPDLSFIISLAEFA